MSFDWILYDTKKCVRTINSTNFEFVQELHHQTTETLDCTRNTQGRMNFNENIFGSAKINLKQACFVERAV